MHTFHESKNKHVIWKTIHAFARPEKKTLVHEGVKK